VFDKLEIFEVQPVPVKINMFFLRYRDPGDGDREQRLVEELLRGGVRINPPDDGWIRIVTHHDVSSKAVQQVCRIVERAVGSLGP
jgi:threonine aldolase